MDPRQPKLSALEVMDYLEEVFPAVRGRFSLLELGPMRVVVRRETGPEDIRPGGTVSGPAMFEAARMARAARMVGLMLLPPAVDDPDAARPYFRALRQVRERLLAQRIAASMLRELSMGMSHDFDVAIEEGATMVRVGTAIFGHR